MEHALQVEYRSTDDLTPYARNARTHSAEQVAQIAGSIREFGFTNPILCDEQGTIIAGHGRLAAAQKLGLEKVPCITLRGLTDTQRRALILADNRLAETAGWDAEMLRVELEELTEAGADLDLIGFDEESLDELIGGLEDGHTEGDTEPEEPPATPVTRRGDVWQLGKHRLMCGDSTSAEDVAKLMGGEKADMVFTDPPYNVRYAEKNAFLNSVAFGKRIQESILGDAAESDAEVGEQLWKPAFANMRAFAEPHCSIYCTMPQGGAHMMMMMMAAASWQVKHELMWLKNNHVLGRVDYNYKHEPIMYGWADTHKFYGKGAHTLSVWVIPKPQQSKLHPTMKPVELVENAILNSSADGDRIMDLFTGSGTTIIAAENTGRRAFGMELAPAYVDVSVKRWQQHTGQQATLDGKTFDEIAAERAQ